VDASLCGLASGSMSGLCTQHSLLMSVCVTPQGLPFCVAGVGDLLALFRCISCRYCFGTSVDDPEILGAPGRVYTTGEVGVLAAAKLFTNTRRPVAPSYLSYNSRVLPLLPAGGRRDTAQTWSLQHRQAHHRAPASMSTASTGRVSFAREHQ